MQTGYPSIDKPWLKYYSDEAINTSIPKCSIIQNIYNNNLDYLSDIAILYFGKKITYKRLFVEIDKTAKALLSYGVKYGDNVAICMPAVPETIYAILALNKIGANANMLNPTFTEEQLIDRINETDAEFLFVVNELYDCIKNVVPKTKIKTVVSCSAVNSLGSIIKIIKKVKKIAGTILWNEFIKHGIGTSMTVPEYMPNHPAIMVYSSGTTGASKGIQLTNDSVNATITEGGCIGFKWNRQDRWFSQVPIWFSTGICATMLVPLRYGITIILEPMYDFEIFYQHIVKYHPNFMITAVGLLEYLMSKRELDSAYREFKYLVAGGEYVAPCTEKKLNEWLHKNNNTENLHKGYGMCECGGTVTASSYKCNVIGSAGIPTPHVTVSAFDLETGKELQYGERGEIRVLSPCKMLGYYKNPKETEKYFHTDDNGDVWACTGDMGYVTGDGSVYVSGRISDSYVDQNNDTIYLFDIERAILNIEAVRQCKTILSEIDGKTTHVAHVVIANNENQSNVLKQIADTCKHTLSESYFPKYLRIYNDALPVAPSGKLDVEAMKRNVDYFMLENL